MKHPPLITKPSYPRSFADDAATTNSLASEVLWEWTTADIKANPNHYLETQGPQFLYDMLLDALDKLQDSECRMAALRDDYESYKRAIRSVAH